MDGYKTLTEGQEVEFDATDGPKGSPGQQRNVRLKKKASFIPAPEGDPSGVFILI